MVQVAALEGFDPVGLRVTHSGGANLPPYDGICYFDETGPDGHRWLRLAVNEYRGHVVFHADSASVSTGDELTRDRLLRWLGKRRGIPVVSSAPYWGRSMVAPTTSRWMLGAPAAYPVQVDGVDGADDTRLPDGSLLVDALALAIVVRG